jgi:hypothetical protein
MASKKSTKSSASQDTPSKADFIRGLPVTTPAAEVVSRAKAAGISLTPQYVYNLRARANVKSSAAVGPVVKRGPGRPPRSPSAVAASPRVAPMGTNGQLGDIEAVLRAIGAELGLGQAIAVLEAEREKVAAMLLRTL